MNLLRTPRAARRAAAALLALAAAGILLPEPAGAAVSPRPAAATAVNPVVLGVGTNYQYGGTRVNMTADLGAATRLGVRAIREDFFWQYVQPTSGTWDWRSYDTLVTNASKLGVDVLPIIGYGVAWATGGDRVMPNTDAARASFATYAAAVASRYGQNGAFWKANPSLVARPIAAVEIWNEPWYPNPAGPGTYAALVRRASAAVRAAAPGVKVLASADDRIRILADGGKGNWITELFKADPGLGAWVDAWSIHPYARDERARTVTAAQDSLAQVQFLRDQLAARRFGGEVWVTELGFRALPTTDYPGSTAASAGVDMTAAVRGLTQLSGATVPNRVARVYAFTMARPTAASLKVTAWDYGYNLVSATGAVTPALTSFGGAAGGAASGAAAVSAKSKTAAAARTGAAAASPTRAPAAKSARR